MRDLTVFVLGSAAIAWVSRGALRHPHSHGFYRFFAWECTLVVALLNRAVWAVDPFSPRQLLSWVLLFGSIVLPLAAWRQLRREGAPTEARRDEHLLGFEKTSRLVTTGLFRHIRHPMYTALIMLAWGATLKHLTPLTVGLGLAATALLIVTALRDEQECLAYFGEPYRAYMKRTRRFIPGLL
ncbi:protein-S-isoprenylcysteine O-methyltransferase Ste14 [Pseudacidovorax sp. 1753]|uniref:methyltransferase family protein n=1 Tax=Pseudacidovorax sp. 1753 TaxID=3156419 RepID=UPI0033912389